MNECADKTAHVAFRNVKSKPDINSDNNTLPYLPPILSNSAHRQ